MSGMDRVDLGAGTMLGLVIHVGTVGSNDESVDSGRFASRLAYGRECVPRGLRRFWDHL
jgi:hypothetical protein